MRNASRPVQTQHAPRPRHQEHRQLGVARVPSPQAEQPNSSMKVLKTSLLILFTGEVDKRPSQSRVEVDSVWVVDPETTFCQNQGFLEVIRRVDEVLERQQDVTHRSIAQGCLPVKEDTCCGRLTVIWLAEKTCPISEESLALRDRGKHHHLLLRGRPSRANADSHTTRVGFLTTAVVLTEHAQS